MHPSQKNLDIVALQTTPEAQRSACRVSAADVAAALLRLWSEYDASSKKLLVLTNNKEIGDAPGPARGLYQLRTALQIFQSLARDSVQPTTFFNQARRTIEIYVEVCPQASSNDIGQATTLALNSQDAFEKAARDVNAWCSEATAYLGYGRDAVGSTDDYAADVSHVVRAMCKSGVRAMQSVALTFESCTRDLSTVSAIFNQLAVMHEPATSCAIQVRSSRSSSSYSCDADTALAEALRLHATRVNAVVERVNAVVERVKEALDQLRKTQVIALLDAFLRHPMALDQLDTRTLNAILFAVDGLVNECRLFMNDYNGVIYTE
ncbi:hypothetical protein SDRG_04680 [Saprolegnia diclina VS20]|uniref:Uncharacterized protein n=1 Tax=Saprolegnia diclina (strain VS20) TaxID=1156394 RepID=T0QJN1_SAPDV|nr:hypothetical protein SDRG_04680 [Saprolegnia diclina VS20]EQC38254.1 hypothetical protein SDRG_04680 [Saprolegnia diclina VS20]|eukprot:XP_008608581.1 hypothetical protein SDRG_04680 [Saprolegnia diclina VS20]